jgi:hypothetical protein
MTVELSMYPFRDDYKPPIRDFLAKLRTHQDLRITTGPTSTVIVGDDAQIMDCLREMFAWSDREHGRAVFVAKFIPGYEAE